MKNRSPLPALAFAALATLYAIVFLAAERERALGALLIGAAVAVVLAARFGVADKVRQQYQRQRADVRRRGHCAACWRRPVVLS